MGVSLTLWVAGFSVATTLLLIGLAIAIPPISSGTLAGAVPETPRVRHVVRLRSRILFCRRTEEAITVDCVLIEIEEAVGAIGAPAGLPFTLQFRLPDTDWFADRAEDLLGEWAEDDLPVAVDLREDGGKVRIALASDGTLLRLELAGAAGLTLTA